MSFQIGPNLTGFQNPSYLREGQDKSINKKSNAQSSENTAATEKKEAVAKKISAADIETQSPKARLNAIANRAFESQNLQEEVTLLQSQNAALEEALQVLDKLDTIVSDQENASGDTSVFDELRESLESITNSSFNNQSLFLGAADESGDTVPFNRSVRAYGVSREDLTEALEPIVTAAAIQGLNPASVRSASNVLSEMAGRTGAAETQVTSNAMAASTKSRPPRR